MPSIASEAVLPQTPTQAPSRGEARLITLLTAGPYLLGVLLQFFIPPGPLPLVFGSLVVGVGLTAVAMAVKGRFRTVIGGFKLATTVLAVLSVASALGTLILQGKPAQFYMMSYGAFAPIIRLLRLDDIFHSVPFAGTMGVLIAGLTVSALVRFPLTIRNCGFFLVHLGIITSLAGAGLSALFSVKGRVDLRIGQEVNAVTVTKNGPLAVRGDGKGMGTLSEGEQLPLGASLALSQFDVDRYKERLGVSLYMPDKMGKGYELKTTFDNEAGIKHRLPQGSWFRIKSYYPDLTLKERLVEAPGGTPALRLSMDGQELALVAGESERADSLDGKTVVLFGKSRPAIKLDGPLHTLKSDSGETMAVKVGQTVKLAGTEVKVLNYIPHFTYDLATKQAKNLSDKPMNPALEVEAKGSTQWLFANMPEYNHGKVGVGLTYLFAPEGGEGSAETVVAVSADEKTALVKTAEGEKTVPLSEGLQLGAARLGALIASAKVDRTPGTASQEPNKPAVMIELADNSGEVRDQLLMGNAQDAIRVPDNGMLVFESRGNDVKTFRSHVTVARGMEAKQETIAVNDPLEVGGWMLYQVNFDPKDPSYSGLEAVRDPGVSWVFAGFAFLFFGVAYMTYIAPRMKQPVRREA